MQKSIFILILLFVGSSAYSQWKKIVNFQGEVIGGDEMGAIVTSIYFLDLPGPIRIGFAGADGEMWKTTDGGTHWDSCWALNGYLWGDLGVSGIIFKDSLTGWFSWVNGAGTPVACYRTMNCGDSWSPLQVPGEIHGGFALNYLSKYNRLFIYVDSGLYFSTDLGDSWSLISHTLESVYFFSDSIGITEGNITDSTLGIFQTTNGGLSWFFLDSTTIYGPPLMIPGTSTCFEADAGRIIVRRSDDYGQTWRILKDFGPFDDSQYNGIAPYGAGYIEGDLSRLYIQSDSGMLVSTDEGITWIRDKGPTFLNNGAGDPSFYAGKGVTIAGWSDGNTGDAEGYGLWEEIWPTSGVKEQEPSPSSRVSVYPNPTSGAVTVSGMITALSVTNVLGQTVLNIIDPPSTNPSIDLSNQPPGVYYIRTQTMNNETEMLKLIKE